ncbi:MAG: putative succinate-semialdehyde dehydrogenase [Subtercola sp.]|nr:putative succinate-semialdehyde dehydrogenase [Subtercola sp.]
MTQVTQESLIRSLGITVPTGLWIGGRERPAADASTFDVIDPATAQPVATVSSATVDDALLALDAAEQVAVGWRSTPPRVKSEILRTAFELMIERREALAALITLENGKALADARAEVTYAAEFFRWYAEEAVRLQGTLETAPGGANRILVIRQPVGVCLLITPWNFPAAMATRKIAPALAAGCTIILKPASETPLTALAMVAILEEAGLPAGVVNVIPSRRSGAVTSSLLADPRIRKISFTGSTEVGRVLLSEAAKTVVNVSMELGGNAPFLVLEKADVDAAVAGAMIAKLRNGGEACTAANRFYVHSSVADEFSSKFADAFRSLTVGAGLDESNQIGPLVNEEARQKVRGLVDGAIAQGAQAIVGGNPLDGEGYFYAPTVLMNVRPDSQILSEEIFGPVAPIVIFDHVDDAVRMANNTEFGLVAYVYTTDLAEGLRVSEAIEAGMIGLNRAIVSDPAASFGGVKQSGIGREGGHDGVLDYTESKYIAVTW